MNKVALVLILLSAACGDDDDSGPGVDGGGEGEGERDGGPGPCTDCTPAGVMTFALPSPAGATLWTTTTMDKVLREAAPPTATGAAIAIAAAGNEFEPFQIVVRPDADASVILSMTPFSGPGTIDAIEIRRVGYVHIAESSDASALASPYMPDPLEPMSFGAAESVAGAENQPYWITVHVPTGAAAGDYAATLTVTVGAAVQDVPVHLHVFGFSLPDAIGFDGNWNTSFEALGGGESLERVRFLKDFFFDHRLVPSGVAWPAGLNYGGGITYDCDAGAFVEEANPYDFSVLGPEYIDGVGWNGIGFPSFQIMQFVDNSTPRPATFCGVDRGGDAFGTDAYNTEWSRLLGAIDAYLAAHAWQDRGYVYVQNEPQGQSDYDIAAFLARLSEQAAPNLRIAISEEPKPAIAEHPDGGGASYDLWWANLSEFDPEYATTRQAAGEDVWWYFLYGDLPPHFNPITIDHSGLETRIAFWAAWKYRIRGFAYYSVTGWGDDPYADPRPWGTNQNGDGFLLYPPEGSELVTSIRWELLREGVEDFEYLRLAAGGQLPRTPEEAAGCDASVASAVSSTTAYTRDTSALQHLRDELGRMLEGAVDGCPVLDSTLPGAHERGAYYLNFQDPAGPPTAEPLEVNGHTWEKIGWEAYDPDLGYGWSGPNIGDPSIMLYDYESEGQVDELQKSILYDDYGRTDTFVWDIENGRYHVTVSIGWWGRTYSAQRVVVEGTVLYDSVETNPGAP